MRGCQAPAGSRVDAAITQPMTSYIRYGAITRGPVPSAGTAFPWFTLGSPRQPLQSTLHVPKNLNPVLRQTVLSLSSSAEPGPLSEEEEAAYQEFMEQRKAERKAWKVEVRRRAKFDPMATPVPSATSTAQPAQRPDGGAPTAASALQALSRPKVPPVAAPPSRLPQPQNVVANGGATSVNGAVETAAPSSPLVDLSAVRNARKVAVDHSDDDDEELIDVEEAEDVDGALDLGGIAAMARKMLEEDDEEAMAVVVPVDSGRGARRSKVATTTVGSRRLVAPAPKRHLMPIAQLQRQRAAAMPPAGGTPKAPSPATMAAAAAVVAPSLLTTTATNTTSTTGRIPVGSSAAASTEGLAAAAVQKDDNDELDWDALAAYEKYEQYVNEVTEEEERVARAAARRAASASATTSTSSKSAKPGGAAAAASSSGPASSGSAAAAAGGSRRGRDSGTVSSVSDPTDKLDHQLDQWEQLLNFFEVVERDSKRGEARQRRLQAQEVVNDDADVATERPTGRKGGKQSAAAPVAAAVAASAAAVGGLSLSRGLDDLGLSHVSGGGTGLDLDDDTETLGEAEVDWQSLERLFLGEGWEAELEDLRRKVEAGNEEANAAPGQGAESEQQEEEEVDSWRDEVSSLLLGLVEISSKRYLGRSLLAPPPSSRPLAGADQPPAPAPAPSVGEEERAVVFWEAPFLLLVQDDSPDPLLEYANRTALSALMIDSFDEATSGLSAASLVDPSHPRSQQEWLWACTEAAERAERYATITSLRLRGPSPGAPSVLASDVTVFRLDSLEEQPIGQVVLARSCRQLLPEEEKQPKGEREPGRRA